MHCTDEAQIACNLKQLSAVALLVPIFFEVLFMLLNFGGVDKCECEGQIYSSI